jgi:NAD(P)H-hydrate repair Nnr-like enzyme with NAD(P)H-hydrate dehydratase domain
VMVVAGSREYHGSAVLAANAVHSTLAALRIGTGYAYLFVPKAIEAAVRKLSPNIIVREFGTDYISDGDMGLRKKELERIDALVIGMGIGRNEKSVRMGQDAVRYHVSLLARKT